MSELLDQVRDVVEGQIDFEGQKLAELIVNIALTAIGVVSFIVGYILQDIKLALLVGLGGTALLLLVIVPPWPFFNKNPVRWLPVHGGTHIQAPANLVIDEKSLQ